MRTANAIAIVALTICVPSTPVATAEQSGMTQSLSAEDYIEIQQLVARYARALDACSNKGYDYVDLCVPDGEYSNSRSRTKWQGRERLAEAAGGATLGARSSQPRLTQPRDRESGDRAVS